MNTDELKNLAREIIENPLETLENLDEDKLVEIKKYINPIGTVVASKKTSVVMSTFNMNESYRKKMLTTSLIAYMFRLLEEYEPIDQLEKEKAWQKSKHNKAKKTQEEHEARLALITDTSRDIIRAFLKRNLQYDADRHVREAHKADAVKADIAKHREDAKKLDDTLSAKPESLYKFMRTGIMSAQATMQSAADTLREINLTLLDNSLDRADKETLLVRAQMKLEKINTEFLKVSEPLAKADVASAWEVVPPADIYHHFDRYVHNHYEQLREITDAVYNERADVDDIIIIYDAFSGPMRNEEAKEFIAQHESDFKQEPIIVENSGITLLGPFKQNRDKINYLGKNTQLLGDMVEQCEKDHKLGKDLIEKKVKAKKMQNITEMGPDADGLANYRDAVNTVDRLGVKKGLTQKEQEEYANSLRIKEDMEVPDGAIQADVFYVEGDKMKKTKLYTQAEAPLHLVKGSPFMDKYQPKK